MDKRDLVAARAHARRLVDERHAERLEQRERALDPLDLERDVMEAGASFLEELREPIVSLRRDELEAGLTDRQERDLIAGTSNYKQVLWYQNE